MSQQFVCDSCGQVIGDRGSARVTIVLEGVGDTIKVEADLCEKCAPEIAEYVQAKFKD